MRRYLLIGSGAAGMAAAENIRRFDPSGEVRMVSQEPHEYYSRPGLAYYLNGEIPREQLFPFSKGHWREMGVHFQAARVVAIDPNEHIARLDNHQALPFDRLLLATGAEALLPEIPGAQMEGVVRLDSLDDADHILRMARRGQAAVVAGGGITALELVEALVSRGMRVHYLLRGEHYWSSVLDGTESSIVEERLKSEGVTIHYQTHLVEVLGHKNRVRAARVSCGAGLQDIPCSLLAAAIGIHPRTSLAKAARLEVGKGIRANEFLQTSHPDIFTAGDAAEVRDPLSGEYMVDSLWRPALEMGEVAGSGMAGRPQVYCKMIPFNVTRLAGLVATIIGQISPSIDAPTMDRDVQGIMRGDSQVWRTHSEAIIAETVLGNNRLRIYLRGNRMAGAFLLGDQELSPLLQKLIRSERDLSALRPALLEPGARLYDLLRQYA